jgi:hypothetical protein
MIFSGPSAAPIPSAIGASSNDVAVMTQWWSGFSDAAQTVRQRDFHDHRASRGGAPVQSQPIASQQRHRELFRKGVQLWPFHACLLQSLL